MSRRVATLFTPGLKGVVPGLLCEVRGPGIPATHLPFAGADAGKTDAAALRAARSRAEKTPQLFRMPGFGAQPYPEASAVPAADCSPGRKPWTLTCN